MLLLGFDGSQQTIWFGQALPADPPPGDWELPVYWTHYRASHFYSYPARTVDLRSIFQIADFYSARQWHSTAIYCDLPSKS